MKVLIIVRSTLYTAQGGDTHQILQTAQFLQQQQVEVDIKLTTEKIIYAGYDLLHFFNIIRPADILYHIHKSNKPFVVTPLLIDYTEYDKYHRRGIAGLGFRFLSSGSIEYFKTIARWIKGSDQIRSISYLWKGQQKSIQQVLHKTSCVLANSSLEHEKLAALYKIGAPVATVPNGVDPELFHPDISIDKDSTMVICVARIEGIKNQLNLIKALNNTHYTLLLIGNAAPNQQGYYNACKKIAAPNIFFIDHVPQESLLQYYKKAKLHILPSWFEVCGLSSLEAAAMGCSIVITDKGYTREYFGELAVYCDPASPASILEAIEIASKKKDVALLQQRIINHYNWEQAAQKTAAAYKAVLNK
ncbi:MAG: glycosyltransferase family 4 protein [Ferruginibacter sp.]